MNKFLKTFLFIILVLALSVCMVACINTDTPTPDGGGDNVPKTFSVSYNANGGSGTMTPSTCTEGGSVTVKRCTFSATSDFVEWNTKADGTGDSYLPADELTPSGDMTLYAIWQGGNNTEDTFTLTYHANGGSGTVEGGEYTEGEQVHIATNGFTYEGKVFSNWNTKADGTGTTYNPGQLLVITENLDLYAIWQEEAAIYYTLTYHANGGSGTVEGGEYTEGEQVHIATNGFTYEGKVFSNWNTKADGTGTTYNPGQLLVITENLDLYAIWQEEAAIYYTLTYHANGATGTMSNATYPQGTLVNILESAFSHNLSFVEWNTKEDGSGQSYKPGDQISLESDLNLYAIWEMEYCTVTFDYQGFGVNLSVTVPKNTLVEEPIAPLADGYTFEGWYTQKEGGEKWIFGSDTISETITLYAHMLQVGVGVVSVNNGYVSGNSIYITVPEGTSAYSLNGQIQITKNSAWKLYAVSLAGVVEVPTRMITGIDIGENFGDGSYTLTVWDVNDENVLESYVITVFRQFTATVNYYGYTYLPSVGEIDPSTGYKQYDDNFELGRLQETETPIKTEKIKVDRAGITLSEDSVPAMAIPGHTLTGYSFEFGVEEIEEEVVDIYPVFEPDYYTVTLYTGTETKEIEVLYDNGIFFEFTPSIEEGEFLGYYTEDDVLFLAPSMYYCDCVYLMPLNGIDALYAKYKMNQYPLTLSAENGEVNVEGVEEFTPDSKFDFASTVTLVATPNTGYHFLGWKLANTEDYLSTESTYTYRIGKNNEIVAVFQALRFTITLDADGYTLEKTEYEVAYGEDFTLPVIESDGYFTGWTTEDGAKITDDLGKSVSPYGYLKNITVTPNIAMLAVQDGVLVRVDAIPANGYLELPSSVHTIAQNAIPEGVKYLITTADSDITFDKGAFDSATDLVAVQFPESQVNHMVYLNNNVSDVLFLYGFSSEYSNRISGTTYCPNRFFTSSIKDFVIVNGGTYYKSDDGAILADYNGTAEIFYTEDSVTIHGVEYPVTGICKSAVVDKSFHTVMVSANVDSIVNIANGTSLNIGYVVSAPQLSGEYLRLPYHSTEENAEYVFAEEYYFRIDTANEEACLYAIIQKENVQILDLHIPETVKGFDGTEYPVTSILKDAHRSIYATVGQFNLYIPYSMKTIGDGFLDNGSVNTIDISNIANWCTMCKNNLSAYNLPKKAKKLLVDGNPIVDLVIPNGVTEIYSYSFANCTSLKSVYIPDSVTTVEQNVFVGCSRVERIDLPFLGESKTTNNTLTWAFTTILQGSLKEVNLRGGTSIADSAFTHCSALEKINLPAVLYSIGENAFNSCASLTKIDVSDSCTTIGNYAFNGCISLTEFNFPSSLRTLGKYAFYVCQSLRKAVLPDSLQTVGERAFYQTSLYSITLGKNLTDIGTSAFFACNMLFEVINRSSLTITAGSDAYGGVARYAEYVITDEKDSLCYEEDGFVIYEKDTEKILKAYVGENENVIVPDGVTAIGKYAFLYSKVKSVVIPDSVTAIDNYAFDNCLHLTEVALGETSGLRSIGSYAFSYTQVRSLVLGPDFQSMNNSAFKNSSIVEIYNLSSFDLTPDSNGFYYGGEKVLNIYTPEVGESILTIENDCAIYPSNGEVYLHSYLGNSTNVIIPEGVTLFADADLFSNFKKSLESITFPSTLKEIPQQAFEGYTKLSQVTFAENSVISTIGDRAFYSCSSLKRIEIPDSVTTLGSSVFANCNALDTLSLPFLGETATTNNKLSWIYNNTTQSTLKEITIRNTTLLADSAFNGFTTLEKVSLLGNVEALSHSAFCDCSSLTQVILPSSCTSISANAFLRCYSLTDITIPDSCESIGSSAFLKCTYLRELIIPEECSTIGNNVFDGCISLTKVSLPSSCTTIGNYAFRDCHSLSEIVIPSSCTTIGEYAFYNCRSLTQVIVPDSVQTISKYAFSNCTNLQSITLGKNLTGIGDFAFSNCTLLAEVINRSTLNIVAGESTYGKVALYAESVIKQK